MIKCKVLPGHRYSHIDRSDGEPKRVLAQPGDVVLVSEIAAKRFSRSLLPVEKNIKAEDRKVNVEKANKELAGESAEQIEEAASKAKSADPRKSSK